MAIAAQALFTKGLLEQPVEAAQRRLAACTLCPRRCGVDRLAGATGRCGIGRRPRVASYGPHFGEESSLVGQHGSGTIFFSGCSLGCSFCQNYAISQGDERGHEVDSSELAAIMLDLQAAGCHNINLVSPSHVVPQILAALPPALTAGLDIPLVFNCSGYEALDTLSLLMGVVDIYLPDCKFWLSATADRYAQAPDYPQRCQEALLAMHRQVGNLVLGPDGLAQSGLLVRHLLMPGGQEETAQILTFLAEQLGRDTYINIMAQYHPCGRADEDPTLCCTVTGDAYRRALAMAQELGLTRLDQPDLHRLLRALSL